MSDRRRDNINHPSHYTEGRDPAYEPICVIEAWQLDFHLGNAVKYISRAGRKADEIEDLKKAEWYLRRKIEGLQGALDLQAARKGMQYNSKDTDVVSAPIDTE